MARFVEITDGYEIRHINADHVVGIETDQGGCTILMVRGDAVRIDADGTDCFYNWEALSKVIDELIGKSDAPVPEAKESAPVADDDKVYKTKYKIELDGIGVRHIWVCRQLCVWMVSDSLKSVFPVMKMDAESGDAVQVALGNCDRAIDLYLGSPDKSRTPSAVPHAFLDQFENPVEVLYALRKEVDALRSHLSGMDGELIAVPDLYSRLEKFDAMVCHGDLIDIAKRLVDVEAGVKRLEYRTNDPDVRNEQGDC